MQGEDKDWRRYHRRGRRVHITRSNNKPNQGIETKVKSRIRTAWELFGKYREIFLDETFPIALKGKTFNQCVIQTLTYGCETWTLIKTLRIKIRSAQRAIERKMLIWNSSTKCGTLRSERKLKLQM